ncbi:MAG TPA: hypothetical protein VGP56_05660, partial [Gaiellaceae bacterium]|nr:hypothetical protein [Gaiellaceae bacterium]
SDLAELARAHAGALVPGTGLDALIRLEFADGLLRLAQADLDGAESCFEQAVHHATVAGDHLLEMAGSTRLALIRLVRGEPGSAAEELERIERRAHQERFWGEAGFAGALRGFEATLAGDAGAADQVAAADRLRRRSGHAYTAMVVAPAAAALGVIWSNVIPESCASWFSCRITFGVSSCFGIAFARLKTPAERTAGSACLNPVELLASICFCTAAVCFFRSAALLCFGAMSAK